MWLKKTVGITLVITLSGIVGLAAGALAFTKPPTVTVITPDDTIRKVAKDTASKKPNLVEQSSSSKDSTNSDGTTTNTTSPSDQALTQPNTPSSPVANPLAPTPKPGPVSPAPNPGSPQKPVVSLSISPAVIQVGGSATLQWSSTNSPTSCSASGAWSGAKPASGSQNTGTMSAGSFVYTISCANGGGTGTTSVTLTVNAPPTNYCGGLSPCIGVAQMSQHATQTDCWGYSSYRTGGSYPRVYDLVKAYNGTSKHRQSNVGFWAKCGTDITNCLNGNNACGSKTLDHSTNYLLQYSSPFGYYDPRKP